MSVGSDKHKLEILPSIRKLHQLGYDLYGSSGTAYTCRENGIPVKTVKWQFAHMGAGDEALEAGEMSKQMVNLAVSLSNRAFDLVINLPKFPSRGARRVSSYVPTYGSRLRRMAIDYSVPLITDVKCAKLLIESLAALGKNASTPSSRFLLPLKTQIDCLASSRLVRLPGLIDVHVHLRDPGATHKEDFSSGTMAALAGGVTLVCAMPNTAPPVTDAEALAMVSAIAASKAHCDYALFLGATSFNAGIPEVMQLAPRTAGLKMYLNETFTTLRMDNMSDWAAHFASWPPEAPLCVHAEGRTCAAAILLASLHNRSVHICHVARYVLPCKTRVLALVSH